MQPEDVIKFWFVESSPGQWFRKDEKFDAEIWRRFFGTYERVMRGETADWRTTPEGRLAEILVLNQSAYPHRNAVLGRESTPEELEFMRTHKGF